MTTEQIDLNRLMMRPGEGRRLEFVVEAEPLMVGGQEFSVPDPVSGTVAVSRTNDGFALHMSFEAVVDGPCQRCLADASIAVEIDAREVDHPNAGDPELQSPYMDEEILDVASWVRDAIALEMPEKPLCRHDCAGLCVECGESLNDSDPAEHDHGPALDPRFAKLRELDLGQD